jgi:hypothetical protein
MSWTLLQLRTEAQRLLNDTDGNYYPTAQLSRWANDGERDIAAKSLCLESVGSATTTTSQRLLTTPLPNHIDILHIEYTPTTGKSQSLFPISPLKLGHNDTTYPYPQYWFKWGLSIGIDPIPDQTYNLLLYLATLPTIETSEDTDTPQIPLETQSLIPLYIQYRALIKDRKFGESGKIYKRYISFVQAARVVFIQKYSEMISQTKLQDSIVAR